MDDLHRDPANKEENWAIPPLPKRILGDVVFLELKNGERFITTWRKRPGGRWLNTAYKQTPSILRRAHTLEALLAERNRALANFANENPGM